MTQTGADRGPQKGGFVTGGLRATSFPLHRVWGALKSGRGALRVVDQSLSCPFLVRRLLKPLQGCVYKLTRVVFVSWRAAGPEAGACGGRHGRVVLVGVGMERDLVPGGGGGGGGTALVTTTGTGQGDSRSL